MYILITGQLGKYRKQKQAHKNKTDQPTKQKTTAVLSLSDITVRILESTTPSFFLYA